MSLKETFKKQEGFTLLELLIVIVIIAILALLIIPNITSAPKKARDTKRKTDLTTIRKGLEEIARVTPLELPNGKILREVDQSRESIDGGIAYEVIKEQFGDGAAMQACALKTSKAAIARVLNGKSKEALASIAANGGIHSKTIRTLREVKP